MINVCVVKSGYITTFLRWLNIRVLRHSCSNPTTDDNDWPPLDCHGGRGQIRPLECKCWFSFVFIRLWVQDWVDNRTVDECGMQAKSGNVQKTKKWQSGHRLSCCDRAPSCASTAAVTVTARPISVQWRTWSLEVHLHSRGLLLTWRRSEVTGLFFLFSLFNLIYLLLLLLFF